MERLDIKAAVMGLALGLLLGGAPRAAGAQGRAYVARVTAADSVRIVAVLADLDSAWHGGDAARWVSHYAADARFVNVSGTLMTDTATLRARLDAIFRGIFRGSRHVGTLRHLRTLGADAVVAEEEIEITGFRALPAGVRPTAPGVLRTRMRHVLQREGGRWVIVASQNTAIAPAR